MAGPGVGGPRPGWGRTPSVLGEHPGAACRPATLGNGLHMRGDGLSFASEEPDAGACSRSQWPWISYREHSR